MLWYLRVQGAMLANKVLTFFGGRIEKAPQQIKSCFSESGCYLYGCGKQREIEGKRENERERDEGNRAPDFGTLWNARLRRWGGQEVIVQYLHIW